MSIKLYTLASLEVSRHTSTSVTTFSTHNRNVQITNYLEIETHFSISFSLKAHSFLSCSSIILFLFSHWVGSSRGGREASQILLALARSIISTSDNPAGRPRPADQMGVYMSSLCFHIMDASYCTCISHTRRKVHSVYLLQLTPT